MKESLAMGTLFLHHPDKMFRSHCVISCHGGYRPGCCGEDVFDIPPGVELVFYSQHGSSVVCFGIDNFLAKVYKSAETLSVDKANQQKNRNLRRCYNYTLTKFQASHKGPKKGRGTETYAGIERAVTKNEEMTSGLNSFLATSAKFRQMNNPQRHDDKEPLLLTPQDDEDESFSEVIQFEFPFDVLTVRNRFYNGSVTLKTAITALLRVHPYRTIHCYFCRS